MKQLLFPTAENPHVVTNYPYGLRRCNKRYWIEVKENFGMRLVTQTNDPKIATPDKKWNKPHSGVYHKLLFLYINPENNHVEVKGFCVYDHYAQVIDFLKECNYEDHLDEISQVIREQLPRATAEKCIQSLL